MTANYSTGALMAESRLARSFVKERIPLTLTRFILMLVEPNAQSPTHYPLFSRKSGIAIQD